MKFTQVCVAMSFALAIVCAPLARAACSNASVNGTYGILSTGLNDSLQPASSLNQIKVDGLGHLAGTATKSINGSIVTYTFKGTYTIGTNCTGTAAFTNQNNQTEHDKIYLNSANLSGLYTGGFLIQTDSNHVQSSIAMNQGAVTCTDLGLKHAYSFEATGTDLGTGQVASAGRVTLNGTGGITGSATLSLAGTIHSSVALNGSYTVNSDCTGTASITLSGFPTSHWNLVVVNGGQEMMAIQTDADTIVTATFQQ